MKINMKIEDKDIKTVVPPLRFPEFRDAEGWEVTKLGNIGNCSGGLSGKSSKDFGNGEPYVTYKQIFNSSVLDVTKCEFVAIRKNEKQTTLKYGDVLITMSSETPEEIGYSSVVTEYLSMPIYLNSFCFLYRPNKLQYPLPDFSRYLFQSPVYRKSISALAQGITRYNITRGKFLDISLPIPRSEEEQGKISKTLNSLDDLISAVTDKIEALKEYKKGLMQQLFPAEGKTTPTLRFPEFQNAGEWRQTTVENICEMQAGKFVSASAIYEKRESEMYPCYGGNGLRGYTYSFTHSGVYLLIGRQGALCGNVTFVDGTFHATEHAVVVTCKEGIVPHWLYYQFTKSNLNQYATGQAQPGLSVEVIKKVAVSIPEDNNKQIKNEEQQKIANYLSSVDELISAQTDKLDQLKAHKKGLMQQLFPTVN